MSGEKNSKDNGFELEDFWGISDSNMQNSKSKPEDEDWSFDDLFAAKEKQDTAKLEEQRLEQERAAAREATRRQIEAEFAAKKKADEEAAAKAAEEAARKAEEEAAAKAEAQRQEEESEKERVRRQAEEKAKMSQVRRKPVRMENGEEAPEPEEFTDTSTMSLNRLKPEIRLTSVEPPIDEEMNMDTSEYENAEFEYEEDYEYEYEDGEYDEEYEYEDGEYDDEYEYEDGEYDDEYEYEDGEYDDEYEYEDGEYDEEYEYDYEAEEETQPNAAGYVPLKKAETVSASGNGQKKEYGTDEDWKVLSGDDEEEEERSKKPLIIGIICGVIVLILIAVIVWAFGREDEKKPVADESSNVSVVLTETKLSGVITAVDEQNGSLSIYNAESGKEESLTFQSGNDMSKWNVGDVVDVAYLKEAENQLTSISNSYTATTMSDIKNAVPNGSIIQINNTTYYIDSKLVCLYQGQAFDVNQITEKTKYNAVVLGDHIYTISISYATGTLKLENLDQYVDATMTLAPTNGDKAEVMITQGMLPLEIEEGSVDIQIYKDNEILYTGKTFIGAGKENTVKLPSTKDKKGKVLFDSNMDVEMTIQINGTEYAGDEEIELAYGDYTGVFTAEGYDSVEMKFTVGQPYQQINVEFKENTTLLTISSSIWGASLYVDGVYQGELEGDSISVRLAPGAHSVTCTRTGYYDQHQSIMILEGMDDQMLYFSGFQAIVEEESSTVPEESDTTTEESGTTTEESSTTSEESSATTEESSTTTEESGSSTEESDASSEETSTVTEESDSTGESGTAEESNAVTE